MVLGTTWNRTTERFSAFVEILDLDARLGWLIEWSIPDFFVRDWNAEAATKLEQLLLVHLLLIVGYVSTFARFAKSITLDRLSQDDRGPALVSMAAL